MASFAKAVSHQATSSRAAVAVLSSQHERGTPPIPSRMHPPYACVQYPKVQNTVGRKRSLVRPFKSRGPKRQRNDIQKHRSFQVKNPPDRIPNTQVSCQDAAFLGLHFYQGADKWFKNLEDLTLPIFKRQENTHVGIDPLPKQVRIAILDTGTKPRWEYRDQVYEKSKNFVSGECAQKYDKDETGHGTAVAYQVARTCPNAMLYIARVAKYNDESGKPVPDKQAVVKALQWASREEVDIIIMSFGWEIQDDGDGVEDELDNIKNKKSILMFAASTNGGALGKMLFPARHCGVIAVDAFDGFGKELPTTGTPDNDCKRERFAAPGNYLFAGGDKRVTGSSYACPIVAGIAGLVIEACRREMPRPEASIYKRLETREAMEAILKLLSTPTGNFNFLTPWENLTWHNPCQTFFFCRTIIEGPMRPYLNTGASFMEKGNKWISLMEQTVIG